MSAVGQGRAAPECTTVRIGFVPLVDSAVIIAADALGFAADEGLRFDLMREISWANIRDRVFVGHLDAAQMLAGMPIAATLGVNYVQQAMIAPMMLGAGGNAISIGNGLREAMGPAPIPLDDPAAAGRRLAEAIAGRRAAGGPKPVMAMVYPFSSHNYELRFWLAAAGIDPDRDVDLIVLPPPLMVDAFRTGHIEGCCVGEPWNSAAVAAGVGHIVAATARIWPGSPDKALGMRRAWADEHPLTVAALVRALQRAAEWADVPANRPALARLLAAEDRIGVSEDVILDVLEGRVRRRDGRVDSVDGYLAFARGAATFPWTSHAAWLYAQMVRWGQADWSPEAVATASAVFQPALFRAALARRGTNMPASDARLEGAAPDGAIPGSAGAIPVGGDGFFDGTVFDPADVAAYLRTVGTPAR